MNYKVLLLICLIGPLTALKSFLLRHGFIKVVGVTRYGQVVSSEEIGAVALNRIYSNSSIRTTAIGSESTDGGIFSSIRNSIPFFRRETPPSPSNSQSNIIESGNELGRLLEIQDDIRKLPYLAESPKSLSPNPSPELKVKPINPTKVHYTSPTPQATNASELSINPISEVTKIESPINSEPSVIPNIEFEQGLSGPSNADFLNSLTLRYSISNRGLIALASIGFGSMAFIFSTAGIGVLASR